MFVYHYYCGHKYTRYKRRRILTPLFTMIPAMCCKIVSCLDPWWVKIIFLWVQGSFCMKYNPCCSFFSLIFPSFFFFLLSFAFFVIFWYMVKIVMCILLPGPHFTFFPFLSLTCDDDQLIHFSFFFCYNLSLRLTFSSNFDTSSQKTKGFMLSLIRDTGTVHTYIQFTALFTCVLINEMTFLSFLHCLSSYTHTTHIFLLHNPDLLLLMRVTSRLFVSWHIIKQKWC